MKNKKVENLIMTGVVVKVTNNTARVKVTKQKFHAMYRKRYTLHESYLADIGKGKNVAEGDMVKIERTRPLSKRKVWRIA